MAILPLPQKADIVVILGAGASVESGVPTFQTFQERAGKVLTDPKLQVALKVWKTYYSQWNLEEVMTARRFHDEIDAAYPLRYSLATAARAAGLPWFNDEARAKGISVDEMVPLKQVEGLILDLVPSTITATANLDEVRQYEILADEIIRLHDAGKEVAVVSFNWDTLFEVVFLRKYGNRSGLRMPWAGAMGLRKGTAPVRLYKPHGSLGFEICMNKACKKQFGRIHVEDSRSGWYETRKFSVGTCDQCKTTRELLVFPPHFVKELPDKFRATPAPEAGKVYAREWYAKTWREIYLAVRDARRVLSLGYSWSFTDYPMRFQFGQAVAARQKKNPLDQMAVVVGPREDSSAWKADFMRLQDRVMSVWAGATDAAVQYHPTGATRFMEREFRHFAGG